MRSKVIGFLEKLLDDFKQSKLTHEDEKKVSEFFLEYNFTKSNTDTTDKELLKYMALGWYIYNAKDKLE